MVEYSKVNTKLTNTQLKKLKTAVKNNTGKTWRMNSKMFNRNNLPHELFLTTRQKKNRLRNAFNNNMQTDIKLSRAHIFKIIQSGEVLGSLLSKLPGPLMKVAVPLAKKYFSSFTNYSCCLSNWCRNSKTKKQKQQKKNLVLGQQF